MKTRILAILDYGQLCNRLFHLSHLLSYALRTNSRLIIMNFGKYVDYFDFDQSIDNVTVSQFGAVNWFFSVVSKIITKFRLGRSGCRLGDGGGRDIPFKVVNSWDVDDGEHVLSHRAQIVSFFSFKRSYVASSDQFIAECRQNGDVLVGMHLRRGDYRTWQGGRYFYELSTYEHIIEKLSLILGGKLVFVVFSDEYIDAKDISIGDQCLIISRNNAVVDLIALSKCDYIVGPPSTFNAWASFAGEVPLYTIKDPEILPTLDSFVINTGNIVGLCA